MGSEQYRVIWWVNTGSVLGIAYAYWAPPGVILSAEPWIISERFWTSKIKPIKIKRIRGQRDSIIGKVVFVKVADMLQHLIKTLSPMRNNIWAQSQELILSIAVCGPKKNWQKNKYFILVFWKTDRKEIVLVFWFVSF